MTRWACAAMSARPAQRPIFSYKGYERVGMGLTSPKSLSRVLEFSLYMGVRDLRWIFLIPNRTKHLPADGLALTPLR